jgi:hypothetical protein
MIRDVMQLMKSSKARLFPSPCGELEYFSNVKKYAVHASREIR